MRPEPRFDSDPAKRNVFGLIAENPDFAQRIHTPWAVAGGVREPFDVGRRDWLLGWIPEVKTTTRLAIDTLAIGNMPMHVQLGGALYGRRPAQVVLVEIPGRDFEFGESLSDATSETLHEVVERVLGLIEGCG